MTEKYLLFSPSGEISWIDLDRKPNYGPVYQVGKAVGKPVGKVSERGTIC